MQRTVSMPNFIIHSLTADTAEAWRFIKNLQRCKAEMFCAFQSVEKPLLLIKMGSQGRSPRQGLGAVAPVI